MPYAPLKYIFLIILLSQALVNCGQQVSKTDQAWVKTITGNFSGQSTTVFDSVEITRFFETYPEVSAYKSQLQNFYRNRKFAYAWFDDGKLIEQAGNLANRVRNLQNEGIFPPAPGHVALDSMISALEDAKQPAIKLELMLTSQYFAFSKLAWGGLNSAASKASGWNLPRKKLDYDQYLDSLLKTSAKNFSTDEPVYRQYELLRFFLRTYRALNASDRWLPINNTKTLKRGDTSRVVAQLKTRLFKLADFHGDTLNTHYDESLVSALKQFQERHGLTVNGELNKATVGS